jgi:hypothetical protein
MSERKIKIFKTFEEQEMYFLEYFFKLTPSQRLQALAKLQKENLKSEFLQAPKKIIKLHKQFIYGH